MSIKNQVSSSDAPKRLSMVDFLAASDQAGSFAKGCRFFVRINPGGNVIRSYPNDIGYMCEAVELPGRGFALGHTRYYGPEQVFPINTEYQPITVSVLCRADSRERRFFDDWLDYINPINTFNFQYPDTYQCEINIYQYADYAGEGNTTAYPPAMASASKSWKPKVTYHWQLRKAWPTLVNAQPVNWSEQDVLRLQVSFAYKYWDRPDYAP